MDIVVSPAKKLNFDLSSSTSTPKMTKPFFMNEASELVDVLKKKKKSEISKLMSLSDSLSELNYKRYQSFDNPEEISPAGFAFAGDTYKGLQIDSFSSDDIKYAKNHLFILSGLYGVLRISDELRPYRLEMGTRLENPKGKNLYEFWRSKIAKKLNDLSKKSDSKYLVNLASEEYFKSVDVTALNHQVINVKFLENKNGAYKVIGLMSKRARGAMARYIVKNQVTDLNKLKKFDIDNYKFCKEQSTSDLLVFKR